jgi:DNA-binding PadR family transcriptional regulator
MARKPSAGPASDPELLILSSLASGAKHGYAIMGDVEEALGVRLGPGTLYTALSRLVEQGFVMPDRATGRQRPYRLTPKGAATLEERLTAMRRVASLGLRRLRTA